MSFIISCKIPTGYDLINQIWIPQLIFTNSLNYETLYIDQRSSITILRIADPYQPPLDEIQENYLYTGLDNPLLYNDTYDLTFHCDFDLTKYPFDTQKCFIKVNMLLINSCKNIIFQNITKGLIK